MARQREPLDDLPIRVAPQDDRSPLTIDARDGAQDTAVLSPALSNTAPLHADATLASPFATASEGVTPHRDQPYGSDTPGRPPHARQRFDLYLPAGCNAGGMPLVVWIHGDNWRDGSKADCPVTWLAQEGYAVASIGYRLTDTATYPAQLDDCRAAIAEIERNAEVWGIDRDRVAVVGSGAGGHLAALVGLVPDEPQAAGNSVERPRVAAVCAVAAPSDLLALGPAQDRPNSAASRLVGGPLPEFREAARRASPVGHVSADDPPILVLHGAADAAMPPRQATALHAAVQAAGADSTLVMLPGVGHSVPLGRSTPGGQALLSFLDRVLGPALRPQAP
jgi:acetyl esterase/lipase